jgi:hypothetical protein
MKITLGNISTKSLATLAQRVINASKNNNWLVVEKHPLLLEIETQYNRYYGVYTKLTFSGKGDAVEVADKKRDTPFGNIKALSKATASINGLANQQAAADVVKVLEMHGMNLDRLSYADETAQMNKLIDALDTEEMQANLTALNLLPTFTEMKQAQTDFETLYAEQAEENAELRMLPSASALRRELEKALRAYFNLLTAMQNVEEWKAIYAEINEIVKSIQGN